MDFGEEIVGHDGHAGGEAAVEIQDDVAACPGELRRDGPAAAASFS
jgi:hypothetical protein